jgi:hypothetical protein
MTSKFTRNCKPYNPRTGIDAKLCSDDINAEGCSISLMFMLKNLPHVNLFHDDGVYAKILYDK